MDKLKLSNGLILALGLFFIFGLVIFKHWERNILMGDSWGYYSYLPSTFIHKDVGDYTKSVKITQKYNRDFVDPLQDKYGLYHTHPRSGKNIIKYTSGLAILLSPFFFIAHFLASMFGYENDGFSEIYRICMAFGIIIWVLLGLHFLLKLLLEYFSMSVAFLTIIGISLCTNLYYNTAFNSIMSHAVLFSLYSMLLYATFLFYQKPTFYKSLIIGLLCGFISLTRMTEIYCILIPILWGFDGIKERISYFLSNYTYLLITSVFFVLPFTFQFYYWKQLTGDFIFNGYIGESFHFLNPQIIYGLFDFDNGWLPWSPIMIAALIGLYFLKKHVPPIFFITIILLPLHIYVIYSWWCYNYINGFGSRPMIHMYPILSFSMGALICEIFKFKFGKFITILLIFCTGALNIFQNYQVSKGLLITNYSSPAYYFHMLGALKSNSSILIARSSKEFQPKNTHLVTKIFSAENEVDTSNIAKNSELLASSISQKEVRLSENTEQSVIIYNFTNEVLEGGDFVKLNFKTMYPKGTPNFGAIWETPFIYVQWRNIDNKNIRNYDSGIYPFQFVGNPDFSIYSHGLPDVWGDVSFYVKIPKSEMKTGVLGIWNPNKTKFYIKDLNIELHK